MKSTSLIQRMKDLEAVAPPNQIDIVEKPTRQYRPDTNDQIDRAVRLGRENPVCSLTNAELKGFFLWVEASNPAAGNLSEIMRGLLLQSITARFPQDWEQYQGYLREHNIVFKHRIRKKI
jgi:hypothetical protein